VLLSIPNTELTIIRNSVCTDHRIIQPHYREVRGKIGELSSRLENNMAGMGVIKAFTAEAFESERVASVSREYRAANFAAIKISSLYVPVVRMLVAIPFGYVLPFLLTFALCNAISCS
jgi:ATP-binding cassette subfamily B protein